MLNSDVYLNTAKLLTNTVTLIAISNSNDDIGFTIKKDYPTDDDFPIGYSDDFKSLVKSVQHTLLNDGQVSVLPVMDDKIDTLKHVLENSISLINISLINNTNTIVLCYDLSKERVNELSEFTFNHDKLFILKTDDSNIDDFKDIYIRNTVIVCSELEKYNSLGILIGQLADRPLNHRVSDSTKCSINAKIIGNENLRNHRNRSKLLSLSKMMYLTTYGTLNGSAIWHKDNLYSHIDTSIYKQLITNVLHKYQFYLYSDNEFTDALYKNNIIVDDIQITDGKFIIPLEYDMTIKLKCTIDRNEAKQIIEDINSDRKKMETLAEKIINELKLRPNDETN